MREMRGVRAAILSFVVVFLASTGVARAGTAEDGAHKFIRSLADQAIASLADKGLTRDEREKRFRDLLRRHFDVNGIGKWVVGRYWRQATTTERKEYLGLFEDLIVKTYARRFREYTNEKLEIERASKLDEDSIAVASQIVRDSSVPPIRIEWRVNTVDGGYRVFDIVVEGVSLAQTTRSEFSSVIRNNGGKIAGLIAALRDKNISLDRTTN